MLAQLLTNNWYAVYRPLVRLKLSFRIYLKKVIMLSLIVFIINISLGLMYQYFLRLVSFHSPITEIIGNMCISFSMICISLWYFVFSSTDREKIRSKTIHSIAQLLPNK